MEARVGTRRDLIDAKRTRERRAMFARCMPSLHPREPKSPYHTEDSVNVEEEGRYTEVGEQVSQTEDMSSMTSTVMEEAGWIGRGLDRAGPREHRRVEREGTCKERVGSSSQRRAELEQIAWWDKAG
jgi:hypothetical protein